MGGEESENNEGYRFNRNSLFSSYSFLLVLGSYAIS